MLVAAAGALAGLRCRAQIDPIDRNLVELGYDQAVVGHGPEAAYAYYYYNRPEFIGQDIALRAAIAPCYIDSELGFKQLLSPTTDVGVGLSGGAFGDNFYDVEQGKYLETQSFYGSGGGSTLSIYQLLDPGMKIPLSLVARVGFHYASYFDTAQTAADFRVPHDQLDAFTRVGLRFAGKQPILYPDLGLELSVWYERQRHFDDDLYGIDDNREITPSTDLYWMYLALDYEFKPSGKKFSLAVTAAGSTGADPFSAWRLGGVLPLSSEFPLEIPGYYYEELTATRLVHMYGSYSIPLDEKHKWDLRFEAASARLVYLPGYEQKSDWQSGAGIGVTYAPTMTNYKIVFRYGYGFNAIRDGKDGAQSVGILFQYDFNARKAKKQPGAQGS